jgi:hypothetical protein
MPTSKETSHGGDGDVTVFGKTTEETVVVGGQKISCSSEFLVLQLPKNYFIGDCETPAEQNGKLLKNSMNFKKK